MDLLFLYPESKNITFNNVNCERGSNSNTTMTANWIFLGVQSFNGYYLYRRVVALYYSSILPTTDVDVHSDSVDATKNPT